MAKFPLTTDGVKNFQRDLYSKDDATIQKSAESAASDFVLWTSENFELSSDQINNFKAYDKKFLLCSGWAVASGVIGKLPLSIADSGNLAAKKYKTTITASATTSYNNQTGATTYSGTIGVGFTLP